MRCDCAAVDVNWMLWLLVCFLLACCSGQAASSPCPPGSLEVKLANNVTVLGVCSSSSSAAATDAVSAYLGIPYAQPPIGELRFRPPKAHLWPENAIFPATQLPPACHQDGLGSWEANNPASKMWVNDSHPKSEDCLYLNVWTPALNRTGPRWSVLVWIYGGSFNSGSAALDVYNGAILAKRENVVVVSMQYRVGVFGFLYTGTKEVPGNQGLWDQSMALRWVKENIGYFYGDENKITVFGESAGAASVGFQLLSPHSQDLFSNAILMSTTPLNSWAWTSAASALHSADLVSMSVGCPNVTSDTNAAIQCLTVQSKEQLWKSTDALSGFRRNRLFEQLKKKQPPLAEQLKSAFKYFEIVFSPVVDGDFIPAAPADILNQMTASAAGKNKRTIVLGTLANEATYFFFYGLNDLLHFYINDSTKSELSENVLGKNGSLDPVDLLSAFVMDETLMSKALVQAVAMQYEIPSKYFQYSSWTTESVLTKLDLLAGDNDFRCPVLQFAEKMSQLGHHVFLYEFQHRTKALSFPLWVGAPHGYEVDYAFGMPFSEQYQKAFYSYTPDEEVVSEKMMQWWTNVAKFNNPNGDEQQSENWLWRAFNSISRDYLVINTTEQKMSTQYRFPQCAFWSQVVPDLLNAQCAESNSVRFNNIHFLLQFLLSVFPPMFMITMR